MALYRDFEQTNDHAFNIYNALRFCKTNNEKELIFENKTYELYDEKASECMLCISNHDVYGLKKVIFLLDEMNDFTIDGNGAAFLLHGSMISFVVKRSKNITLKNFTIDIDQTMIMEAIVTGSDDKCCEAEVINRVNYLVQNDSLTFFNDSGDSTDLRWICLRSRDKSKNFVRESKDFYYKDIKNAKFEKNGEKRILIKNSPDKIDVGMHILLGGNDRYGCNIFCVDSRDINIDNITMYRSYGMGIVGQKTENIEINSITVKAPDGCVLSLNADATHFINCKGLISVKNSHFSEQMDDALNIHGVFTKIVDKTKDYILIRYMHHQAKGINTYGENSKISVVNPETLISNGTYEIDRAEVINLNYTKLYIKGGTDKIAVNDLVEDLDWSCGLIFENNRVENNRARGILIAAKGKVLIRNNYFNTPGTAILFESNGKHWFESGGTTDVTIENNVFYNCKYACTAWGNSVINVAPREQFNEGKYYHKYINISRNSFINNSANLIYADNIEKLVIENNGVDDKSKKINIQNCGCVLRDCEDQTSK